MRYSRILDSALILLAVSCSPEPAAEQERAVERIPDAITIRAHSELLWSNKDAISVFDAEFRRVNFTTSQDNVPSATFSSSSWTGKAPVYAVFCSRRNETTCTPSGVMGVFIKGTQTAGDKGHCPKDGEAAVGIITGSPGSYDVNMKNVGAFIKVNVKTGIVGKINVSSKAGETMTGYVDVDYAKISAGLDGFWTPTHGKTVSASASLVPASGTCFEKGEYLISILPGTYSGGISFVAYDDEGTVLCREILGETSGVTLKRNGEIPVTITIDSSFEFPGTGFEGVSTGDILEYDEQ